ncbi:hypothetical protein O1M54_09195 [Streptomyces diastatochromogenes]|nr:hypothetical protein [Streptomyces diastatochromogenes]
MFGLGLATQTGWLYPLAAFGLVGGVLALRRRGLPRTDPLLAGYLLWGCGWRPSSWCSASAA